MRCSILSLKIKSSLCNKEIESTWKLKFRDNPASPSLCIPTSVLNIELSPITNSNRLRMRKAECWFRIDYTSKKSSSETAVPAAGWMSTTIAPSLLTRFISVFTLFMFCLYRTPAELLLVSLASLRPIQSTWSKGPSTLFWHDTNESYVNCWYFDNVVVKLYSTYT